MAKVSRQIAVYAACLFLFLGVSCTAESSQGATQTLPAETSVVPPNCEELLGDADVKTQVSAQYSGANFIVVPRTLPDGGEVCVIGLDPGEPTDPNDTYPCHFVWGDSCSLVGYVPSTSPTLSGFPQALTQLGVIQTSQGDIPYYQTERGLIAGVGSTNGVVAQVGSFMVFGYSVNLNDVPQILFNNAVSALDQKIIAASAPTPTSGPSTNGNSSLFVTKPVSANDIGFFSPSMLSSLTTLSDINFSPQGFMKVAAASIVFSALLAFPTLLIQRATRFRYIRFTSWLENNKSFAGFRVIAKQFRSVPQTIMIPVGLILASFLISIASPTFGVNALTARLQLTNLIALTTESVLLFLVLGWLVRLKGAQYRIEFRVGSLLIVGLTVLFTRLTNFEPGIIFGLILMLVLTKPVAQTSESWLDVRELILAGALGLLSWFGYSFVSALNSDANYFQLVTRETLAMIALSLLSAVPIALLPFGDLPGHLLMKQKFGKWLTLFALSLIAFFFIVMPLPQSWSTISWPLTAWIAVFVTYSVIAITFWVIDIPARRRQMQLDSITTKTINGGT